MDILELLTCKELLTICIRNHCFTVKLNLGLLWNIRG